MKNILKSSLLLLAGMFVFTACSDDNGSNPTLTVPDTFTLNTPSYAADNLDLESSESVNFTWSQPDFGGFPVAVSYLLQVSLDNKWDVSVDEANADETGTLKATYAEIDQTFNSCKGAVEANLLDKAILELGGWEADDMPETVKVYARAKASLEGVKNPIYSNVVQLDLVPYYMEFGDATVVLWYLIGENIGDGSWSNDPSAVGTAMIPMYPIDGEEYDKKSGTGLIEYIGYFDAAKGFKLVKNPGSWDDQYGSTDEGITPVHNDGGSSNFFVPESGLYRITLNTALEDDAALTIAPYEGDYGVYSQISMPGSYQGWDVASNLMDPISVNVENHDWFAELTFDEDAPSDGGVKFAADGAWDVNWGSDTFPNGWGTNNGPNIPFKAGTYKVFFNDITGCYMFVAQ